MPQGIRHLAKKYLRSPQTIVVENNQDTTPKIDQRYYLVNAFDKLAALTRLFEIEPITSALIFTKTRVDSDELAGLLASRGYGAEALNGDLSQDARERTFRRFRDGKISVLVATDVAARGLDVKDISHVFNYDLPYDTESYVHRVGRTGRAGKEGIAISLVTPSELWRLRRVERDTRQRIKEGTLPSEADIRLHRENQLINQVEVWLRRGRCRREQEIVADLVEAGNDPLMVAAVALKVARAEEKQRPIAELSPVETRAPRNRDTRSPRYTRSSQKNTWQERKNGRGNRESKRSHENGMIRLSLGTGRTHGIRPGDVVGAIARHANIPGETIGKIFIQDHHTFVDIEEQYVSRVLGKTGSYRIRQYQNVTIEKA
jgi:ATP-dependent RNA helicase DeaD